jgi:hypothetical protein
MLVGEPDELGLESAHPQLALRPRLIELPEADGHVTADDDRTPARLDDDHLHAARVARRRDEAEPGQQLELAVDRLVAHASTQSRIRHPARDVQGEQERGIVKIVRDVL